MNLRSTGILGAPLLCLAIGLAGARGVALPLEPAPAAPQDELALALLPEPAYLERAASGWLANWDLLLTNSGERTWTMNRLQVSVFDGKGALEWQKFVDGNGVSPSLLTIPVRVVGPGAQLLVLNPLYAFPVDLALARVVFELDLESGAEARTLTAEVVPVRYENQAELRLPLAGGFLVWDGHDFLAHHRRWDYTFEPIAELGFDGNAYRYSYDFLPLDAEGARSHGDEADNASWVGFGQPILAPAAGKVVAVVDDRPDDRTMDMAALAADLRNVFGNYVVVDHGHGEHSVFGHIQQASAKVRVGDAVVSGQVIAAIGASGSSLMPHLHYQLQNDASGHAEGMPSYFHGYTLVRGARKSRVAFGQVDSGDLLEGDPPGAGR